MARLELDLLDEMSEGGSTELEGCMDGERDSADAPRRDPREKKRLTSIPTSRNPPWTTSMPARTPPGHPFTTRSFLPVYSRRTSRERFGSRSPRVLRKLVMEVRVEERAKASLDRADGMKSV
jgi:hypothetical protein